MVPVHPVPIEMYWWAIRGGLFAGGTFAGGPSAGGPIAGGLNAELGSSRITCGIEHRRAPPCQYTCCQNHESRIGNLYLQDRLHYPD